MIYELRFTIKKYQPFETEIINHKSYRPPKILTYSAYATLYW